MSSIVIVGSPINRFEFYGPFDYREEAVAWAHKCAEGSWWVKTLREPTEYMINAVLRQWILVVGNMIDGLDYYGPFPTMRAVNEWASEHIENSDRFPHRLIGVKRS